MCVDWRSGAKIGRGALIVCAILVLGPISRAAENNAALTAAATITASELKSHVDVLADDSLEGREGGSRGGKAAGGYLAAEMQKLGLKGGGDSGSFFQSFPGGQRNLLGVWEGSDPELKKQYVVIGAHYDHVGYGSRTNSFGPTGYIHNGADDNASGVAGLLEIIEAFTSIEAHPQRSVLFAMWDGEEKGLLGSKHWLRQPTVSTKDVVLYINLDMIGRLRKSQVEVYGTRTTKGLRWLTNQANQAEKLVLDYTWEMKENSDHYSFYERGMPTMMFHTGLHDNYHRPSDDAHLINNDGIQQVAKLVFGLAYEVANSKQTFAFRSESRREDPYQRRIFEQPIAPSPPRLGVEWQDPKAGEAGVVIAKVTTGLPAAKAGFKTGDRLVKFDGQEVTGDMQLRQAVLAAPSPAEAEVIRAEQAEPVKLTIELNGAPIRVGITWRDDPAEPNCVLITQVVYGSAAHAAGLKERDRIYEVGGKSFTGSTEFLQLINESASPLDVLAERSGILKHYSLTLPTAR